MSKTKQQYVEEVQRQLDSRGIGADTPVDDREIILKMDEIANEMAAQGFFENWQAGDQTIGEGFITTFDDVTVVDQKPNSYVDLPAKIIDLPRDRGLVEVYPTKKADVRFIIREFRNIRRFANNPANNLDGRIGCYRTGQRLFFQANNIKERFGSISLRLAIVDAGQIGATDNYPIPANKDHMFVGKLVEWFALRGPQDNVNDNTNTQ